MPRRLITTLFYSVNGIAEAPNTFQFDSFDDDLARLMSEAIAAIDTNILGRVTYQEWAQAFRGPEADPYFGPFINNSQKFVASRTLAPEDITWANSELIEGDLVAFVRELKSSEGGTIAVQGSLSVVRQLVEAGLIDELTLIIHPVIAGSGAGLFDGLGTTRLKLLSAEATEKGNILAAYAPF